MRFLITMNMPSHAGKDVHQIIGDHAESNTLEEFLYNLNQNDFIVVEEFYRDESNQYYSVKKIILNTQTIGKAKELAHDVHGNKSREAFVSHRRS